ncbi:unnamed protein product [Colias eurytheme]|nr:unnamed protein product [Colias eurytheme]
MKVLLEIVSLLLYFEFILTVQMNYVYNDNPNLGYIAAMPSIGSYTKTKFNGPRKYYVGNTNQKYMKLVNEEAINSLFSVKKNPPNTNDPVSDKNQENEAKNLQYDKHWQVRKFNNNILVNNANNAQETSSISRDTYKSPPLKNDIVKEKPAASQERKHYDYYGIQDKYNKVNIKSVAKPQVDQFKATIPSPQRLLPETNNETNVDTKDDAFKNNIIHNDYTMTKLFSDMTQKAFERYQRKQEFRKRETNNQKGRPVSTNADKSKIKTKSDVKFHKEHNVKFLDNNRHIPARIGKNEENDKPYALFYRSHENFDHRDFYTGVVDQSSLDNTINGAIDIEINVRDKTDNRSDNKKTKKISNVKLNKRQSSYDDAMP